ncbi:hypothetical protein GC176_00960 [bacterium]|nr:hypothetical protein [bacterium]
MLKLWRLRFVFALLAVPAASAQADDLLAQLSGAPPQLVQTITVDETGPQADETVQDVSYSIFDGQADDCCTHGACGDACGCGCGSSSDCLLTSALNGVFGTVAGLVPGTDLKSDRCFEGFIEPVTNSVFFEDPRSRTRVRFLFINQQTPPSTPVLGHSSVQVYGMQATFALNERLSVIAQKDGWINIQSDGIGNSGGWANLATGLKYVLVRDVENQFLLSGGVMYEWSNGSSSVFQGHGDGIWTPFLTAGQEIACNTHVIGTVGAHLPSDKWNDSTSWYYSFHLDHAITEKAYLLTELNGIHYTSNGGRLPVPIEGGDLINLGSTTADGSYLVTMAFGGTYKFSDNWQSAAAYEIPLTGRNDIFQQRLTFTLSFIY